MSSSHLLHLGLMDAHDPTMAAQLLHSYQLDAFPYVSFLPDRVLMYR